MVEAKVKQDRLMVEAKAEQEKLIAEAWAEHVLRQDQLMAEIDASWANNKELHKNL